jgi:hypothetical protein
MIAKVFADQRVIHDSNLFSCDDCWLGSLPAGSIDSNDLASCTVLSRFFLSHSNWTFKRPICS